MGSSTNLISGLSSGFDWQSMITKLIAIDHRRVDIVSGRKTAESGKLAEWQSFNTKLLGLKTAAAGLRTAEAFSVFKAEATTDNATVKATDLLTISASDKAAIGSYALKVNSLATAEKISSSSFASLTASLGDGYAGDILINGVTIGIAATDTLLNVRDRINSANTGAAPTGVTASLINYGAGDYRLLLSSDHTGAAGINLANGGGADILNKLGFTDSARSVKNHLAGGDRTDRFTSTNVDIASLLGLNAGASADAGEIVINGRAIGAVDLKEDTLLTLQGKLTAAGLTASITSETENGQTYYRLMVAGGANTYTDRNNILETLGFIEGGLSDVYGVTGDMANTKGGDAITSATLIKDIDGYTGWEATDYIRLSGKDSNGGAVLDETFTLTDTATIGDLLTKIESVFGDVTATITGEGALRVTANGPGASPLEVLIGLKNQDGGDDNTLKFAADGNLGAAVSLRKRQVVAGADASITLDGVTIRRSQNTIDDVITGVTLNLAKADANTTVFLNVGRDLDAVMSKISAFVTSYNVVMSYINSQTSYDATNKKAGGTLFGDGTLVSVKNDLSSTLLQSVWGVSGSFSTLGLVGINVDNQGLLSIDNAVLKRHLNNNYNDVLKLFALAGSADTGTLEYISNLNVTKQGEYAVHIDAAATRSASAPSDNTSLSGDEVLTINEGGRSATVNLTAGMTTRQIAAALNSELTAVYNQRLAGDKELYADAAKTSRITAATRWADVHDSDGDAAGLVNGDTIAFSGTARNGAEITGSYRINDVGTDTVQGLLSAIETAFGNQVTASIDNAGRIVVADMTTGSSNLSFTFDTQPHSLDFGTVTTGNAGGRTGRYALDITASVDGDNHLVLTHNSYGSAHAFTIHQENDLLWTSGDQEAKNGRDVAGTINGEKATGTGQLLRGDNDAANTAGLVVKYTGTATGNAGNVKLTLGAAELFDRVLFNITDSLNGYVSFKQNSLQNSIGDYERQIREMEARLDRKREQLLNRYALMELALQKIQSQSVWLAGQLAAAANGWATKNS
ncbi:MAG: flagellar filament capping protein FliD [Pseudomonadota bacterium]|nr:flagellar filament capping protein FliD [Pseudomonadota bacterium]